MNKSGLGKFMKLNNTLNKIRSKESESNKITYLKNSDNNINIFFQRGKNNKNKQNKKINYDCLSIFSLIHHKNRNNSNSTINIKKAKKNAHSKVFSSLRNHKSINNEKK